MEFTEISLHLRRRKLPFVCKIIYLLTAVSACLYVAFTQNADFADWFNRTVSPVGRAVLAYLTNPLPFSLGEMIIILLPFLLVLLIAVAYRHYSSTWRDTLIYAGMILCAICVILILFIWNFAAGYFAPPLDQKLEIDRTKVSADELGDTAEWLAQEVRDLHGEITFLAGGESLMPYSYSEMNRKLLEAYERAVKKYDFIDRFSSSVKPIMLSHPMSYTHITGVYTFFTGEANLNVNFPDYTLPFTAAHELAHQRGIAREDEANFVAFLVCINSDDQYIRYCGYLNMFEYVAPQIYSSSPKKYSEIFYRLPKGAIDEIYAYADFFEKYADSVAGEISESVNNSYLQMQGTVGTKSYGLVVDLTVAYYNDKIKN